MHWIKSALPLTAVLRFTLPFCAVFLFALSGLADIELDEDGYLTIGDGETITTVVLDSLLLATLTQDIDLMQIIIAKEGTLEIAAGTMVHLGEGILSIKGTLIVPSTLGTGIYSSEEPWDGADIGELSPDKPTVLNIDGGTVKIQQGTHDTLLADTINVNVLAGGGTIDIEEGVTLQTGTVTGTGNVAKTGGGTHRIGYVQIGGTFNVEEGTINFLDKAIVGKLNSGIDTYISGLQADGDSKSDLLITKGGKIEGTLENIGYLIVGDGTSSETLSLEGEKHSIERVGITRNAILDIKAGTSIQLTSADAQDSYDDLYIEGTLRISSASGTGIYKGDIDTLALDSTYITVAGMTNGNGDVFGGIVEIYKSDPESDTPEFLTADTLHTKVIGIGQINVDSGVTFTSGSIKRGGASSGAHVIVSGSGTYRAAEVDLGTGYFMVRGDGTTIEFLQNATAGAFASATGTKVIAHENARFGAVNVAGSYESQGKNLTIEEGGWITGQITGINELTLGGDLLLKVRSGEPTISVHSFKFSNPGNSLQIRVTNAPGIYNNVIEVQDNSINELLNVLRRSETALYKPTWTKNGTFLNLNLNILSVETYIRNEWRKSGQNVGNAGRLIDSAGANNSQFREYVEGLSDSQIQSTLRTVMAGELAGNAMRFALQQPSQAVFKHLGETAPLRSPSVRRGQVREGFNVWFTPFGQAEHAASDAATIDGYDSSRYGFHLGSDVEIYNRAVAGVLFGYTNPNMKNDLGKISANDYTAGLYLRTPTVWEVIANVMVGFGSQDYQYKSTSGSARFRGSSLFASAELSKSLTLPGCRLTPFAAFDFQSAAMDGFVVPNPNIAVMIDPEDVSQTMFRVGLSGNFWKIRTRAQYMYQIAGGDSVSSRTALAVGDFTPVTHIRSIQWGRDWLNVGIGGELLATRHWHIFADYNFDWGRHTTSHLGSLTTALQW